MKTEKYELTDETTKLKNGKTGHRIKALVDIGDDVKAGDLGGFIEQERNLSHKGSAWVFDNAMVEDVARVFGNAKVCNNAVVSYCAKVYDNAKISGDAIITGEARVYGNATVSGNVHLSAKSRVYGEANVFDNASIIGDGRVYDNASLFGSATLLNGAQVYGRAKVCGDSTIYAGGLVYGNATVIDAIVFGKGHIFGDVTFSANAVANKNARISSDADYYCVMSIEKTDEGKDIYTTFYRTISGGIGVHFIGFRGSIDAFAAMIEQEYGNTNLGTFYRQQIELAKSKIRR